MVFLEGDILKNKLLQGSRDIGYFAAGLDILNSFIGNTAMGVLGVMLKLVLISNVVYFTISVVFFVLKKIPFLGLEQ